VHPSRFRQTTLLADWARHLRTPVGWLSLDTGDNDPTRFWRYVGAALDEAGAGVGSSLAPLLRGSQPSPPEAVVTALINTVASHAAQIALVLDDYHLIEAAPIHRGIALLLDRLPWQLRLVIASRADPPVPLARMRARGQLAELRAADLRFTVEETATFLRQIAGLQLPADSVTALGARTEGWAAGLQLAGLSLRGQPDPAGFVAAFSGDHRFVLDYLTEEVLAQQPEQVVRFLLETSILDRLSGPLCDAVTGRTDSQALLERIEWASGDEAVTQVNAQHCQQAIAAHHGRARLIQLGPVSEQAPGQPPAWRGHNLSAFVALPKVLRWFETLR